MFKACKTLLSFGIDPEFRDNDGLTALELAGATGHFACAGFLLRWIKQVKNENFPKYFQNFSTYEMEQVFLKEYCIAQRNARDST